MDVTKKLSQIRPMTKEEQEQMIAQIRQQQEAASEAAVARAMPAPTESAREGFDEDDPTTWGSPGRNDPCPCGSGKKFKHCHGRLA